MPTELTGAQISPDGRYVAYESWEGGRPGIYVRSFPQGKGQWQVAANEATTPRWNPRGGELFYLDNSGPQTRVMVVSVDTRGQFSAGQAKELFTVNIGRPDRFDSAAMDVSADGQRFVLAMPLSEKAHQGNIAVVQNWYAEFRGRKQ